MPIQYVSGDIFFNTFSAKAFAHGCNCQGSMGAGIAKTFKERYPEMYDTYRELCKSEPRQFNLGDVFLWKEENKPWVFNLGTQEGYWHDRASYEAIEEALTKMQVMADEQNIERIAITQIGTGYGGLSWKKVRAIIEKIFSNWHGTLIVYEEYIPGQ